MNVGGCAVANPLNNDVWEVEAEVGELKSEGMPKPVVVELLAKGLGVAAVGAIKEGLGPNVGAVDENGDG